MFESIDEAKRVLAEIRPHLARMVELAAEGARLRAALRAQGVLARRNGHLEAPVPAEDPRDEPGGPLEQLTAELRRIIAAITSRGVEVKDIERGLIDFPFRRGDEVVYLCFEWGEPDIAFWHRVEDGYRGRRPISEL